MHILLSPPGKIDLRRAFLFFSSGAIGSGFELCTEEGSRELLFILKRGGGGGGRWLFFNINTIGHLYLQSLQSAKEERESFCKFYLSDV